MASLQLVNFKVSKFDYACLQLWMYPFKGRMLDNSFGYASERARAFL